MSLIKTNNIETNKVELEISVDAETFNKAVNAAYRKNIRKINVPGFRVGKAPQNIVEKLYGEGVFFEDAVNACYPDALEDAIKESGLDVVGQDNMEIKEIGKDKGFTFTAVVITKPEVKLGKYKGIALAKETVRVKADEIDEEVKRLQDRNSRMIAVEDRDTAMGDTVEFDFDGYVDGKPFDGGKAEDYSLELGSGQFIPGFEEQMVGHKAGDEFDVNVTFPKDYHAEELKGKPAVFKIKVKDVKCKELPALDDEFAKDVSEFDTLADLKADIKKKISEDKSKAAETAFENKLIDAVVDDMKVEVPDVMVENGIDNILNDMDYRLRSQGLDLPTYLKYTGMEIGAMRDSVREQAEKQVKVRLALEAIAKAEDLKASDEDVEKEFASMAEKYSMKVEDIKARVSAEDVAADLAMNKAIDFVKTNAVKPAAKKAAAEKTAEEKPAEEKKAPAAKKTTAKKKAE